MLRFAALAAVGALSAAGAAQTVVMLDRAGHPHELRSTDTAMAATRASDAGGPPATGHPGEVAKAPDGHFWAQGVVGGKAVRFLVDTGATAVALTSEDAIRLGIDPKSLKYGYKVMTASGQARAAQVKLASLTVAGARVDDVDALVIENGLPSSLLGMTYLGRLSTFEASKTSLVLRP